MEWKHFGVKNEDEFAAVVRELRNIGLQRVSSEPLILNDIWYVLYMPIGNAEKVRAERFFEEWFESYM